MKKVAMAMSFVAVLVGLSQAQVLPEKEEILARFVTAVGGVEALNSRSSVDYAGTIVQDLSWKDPTHSETPFRARADATGKVIYAEGVGCADFPEQDSGTLGRKLRWLMLPDFALKIETSFPELQVQGRQLWQGRQKIVLVPENLDPTYYTLFFDEESGLLTHIGFYVELSDWRSVEGVLFPHRFSTSRKGGHTTWMLDEVTATKKPPEMGG
nr:hypothetical protein [Candidatus Krumholzibacteria bacterium]